MAVRDLTFQFSVEIFRHVVHLLPDFSLIQTAWGLKLKTLSAVGVVPLKFRFHCTFQGIM